MVLKEFGELSITVDPEVLRDDALAEFEKKFAEPAGRAFSARMLEELAKPPMITVRGDILAPLLVYVRKFFQCVQHHNANGFSRMMEPGEYRLNVSLEGFTPEDWNSMQSLAKSAGADLEEVLDALAGSTPQMSRPEVSSRRRRLLEVTDTKVEIARLNAKMGVADVTQKALEARKEEEKDG